MDTKKIWARVVDGAIWEVFLEPDDDFEMADRFPPELVWVDITNFDPMPGPHWTAVQSAPGKWKFTPPQAVSD